MVTYTTNYGLSQIPEGESLFQDGSKYSVGDRATIDSLLYLGATGHHHRGVESPFGGIVPTTTPTLTINALGGTLPGGNRVFYRWTLVDGDGNESTGSASTFADIPEAIAAPAAPELSSDNEGELEPGIYFYVLTAYQGSNTIETTAINAGSIDVPASGNRLRNTASPGRIYANATEGDPYGLYLSGATGAYASIPDHASLDITGDIDIRVRVALNDWSNGGIQSVVGKWTPDTDGNRSYAFSVGPVGTLEFAWSPDGIANLPASSTASVSFANGEIGWIRVTMDVDNGASGRTINFYTGTTDTQDATAVSWTALGTSVVQAGVTSIFSTSGVVTLGTYSAAGAGLNAVGRMFSAAVLSGIGGTTACDVRFTSASQGWAPGDTNTATGVEQTGKTVTIHGTARVLSSIDVTSDIDVRWFGSFDSLTPGQSVLASKWGTELGWVIAVQTGSHTVYAEVSTTGANVLTHAPGVALSAFATADQRIGIRFTRVTATGVATLYYSTDEGDNWTQIGGTTVLAAGTPLFPSSDPLEANGIAFYGGLSVIGYLDRLELRRGIDGTIVASPNFAVQLANVSSFDDSQAITWNIVSPAAVVSGTHRIILTLPALPAGASGFNVYRRKVGHAHYYYLDSIAVGATPPLTYLDDGTVDDDCERGLPQINSTGQTNSISVTLTEQPPIGYTWKLYRSYNNTVWTDSRLAHITAVGAQATPLPILTYLDTGTATTGGSPPAVSPLTGNPDQIVLTDGVEITGTLPLGHQSIVEIQRFEFEGLVTATTGTRQWVCEYPNALIVASRGALRFGSAPASTPVEFQLVRHTFGATPTNTVLYTTEPTIPVGSSVGEMIAVDIPAAAEMSRGDTLTANIVTAGGGATPTDYDLTISVLVIGYGFEDDYSFDPAHTPAEVLDAILP